MLVNIFSFISILLIYLIAFIAICYLLFNGYFTEFNTYEATFQNLFQTIFGTFSFYSTSNTQY